MGEMLNYSLNALLWVSYRMGCSYLPVCALYISIEGLEKQRDDCVKTQNIKVYTGLSFKNRQNNLLNAKGGIEPHHYRFEVYTPHQKRSSTRIITIQWFIKMAQVGFKPTSIRIRYSQTLIIIIIFTDVIRKINCKPV